MYLKKNNKNIFEQRPDCTKNNLIRVKCTLVWVVTSTEEEMMLRHTCKGILYEDTLGGSFNKQGGRCQKKQLITFLTLDLYPKALWENCFFLMLYASTLKRIHSYTLLGGHLLRILTWNYCQYPNMTKMFNIPSLASSSTLVMHCVFHIVVILQEHSTSNSNFMFFKLQVLGIWSV